MIEDRNLELICNVRRQLGSSARFSVVLKET